MSIPPAEDGTQARRLVEAAAWRAHLTEIDAETSEAFESWLAADPRNAAAWRQVQAPWTFFGEQANAPELLELRRTALREARDASRKRWRPASFSSRLISHAIAAGALLAVIGALFIWSLSRPDVYRTVAGERRVITLEDGSQVALDSRSEVRVRYTEHARDLTLTTGQARFDVAHDAGRPFSVTAGRQRVVATGTAFNVDLLGRRVFVTLIEGRVVVLPREVAPSMGSPPAIGGSNRTAAAPPAEADARNIRLAGAGRGIELSAGEQLIVEPEAPPSIVPVNIERATAWQNGRLVFENEPLSTVVARVSRYSSRPLRAGDEHVSRLRISGVFNSGDIDAFIATITAYLPVTAERTEDGAIELRSR